jgi:hypothetical protein
MENVNLEGELTEIGWSLVHSESGFYRAERLGTRPHSQAATSPEALLDTVRFLERRIRGEEPRGKLRVTALDIAALEKAQEAEGEDNAQHQ